ncbi:uncharacterized protein LOC132254763 [Vitis vinifera]|nr:uncharacterized protein LOC132254763 [Vitis vinifera]
MTVVCTIEDCPWKITARAIGDSNIVQVHTFRNVHNHCLEDVALSQPLVRSTHASLLIDDVIRSTPEYQPRQICKDFVRQHDIQLTYLQTWQIKEKAKERIYGQPKNYYKLLPWMCERMLATNPGLSVELSYSDDDHFEKLFVAHSISIEGFVRGCRPIIAIDSTHMSGPYGGALFSATAYDANDSMFSLAFGVMSSENYEDWLWFLEKLKIVVGNKEVIIISDRHPTLLRSVPKVFGIENHACCYRHLKENFSSFLSKHNTRGNKGKEDALQFLDSIVYGRLEYDYNVSMFELKKYNEALAIWVEENAPHHWAMSKFPKQRWDKMTTNLVESFNAWLRIERHHSICNFLLEHMSKLASMLVKHQEESKNWKGCIGPKIEAKVQENITKGAVYPVTPFKNGVFGMFIPVCENNLWHVHVVNFAAGRVEILSSLPLRRGNNISAAMRRLSMTLHKALHAYRIHMDADVSSFVHVQPHLLQQLNGSDCGVLILKFMEFWNGATLTTSVAEDKTNMYRLQLVLQLVLNERNSVRDTIMVACHL